MGQCGHYSEKVRLEAINGLVELLSNNPTEARCHAALIISTVSERTADADSGCRAAQRDLFKKALLPALGKEALQPFIPLIMGHICAAMTHLAEPIRADSLKLLEVIMQWRADLIVAGYITQVLQHFGDALARPARGRSLKAGSLGALISIVSGLHSFLLKALPYINRNSSRSDDDAHNEKTHQRRGGDRSSNNTSEMNVAATEGEVGRLLPQQSRHQVVLCWQRCRWPPPRTFINPIATTGTSNMTSTTTTTTCTARTAARAVLDLLLECWMECSPGELSRHPELAPARAATMILQCCYLLLAGWGTGLAGSLRNGIDGGSGTHHTRSAAVAILEKIAIYFPIVEPSIALEASLRDQLVQLNVSAAQLLVRFLSKVIQEATAAASAIAIATQGQQQYNNEPLWVLRLLDWLQGVMAFGITLPAAEDDLGGGNGASGGKGEGAAGRGGNATAGTGEIKQQQTNKKKKKKNKKISNSSTIATPNAAPISDTTPQQKSDRTTTKSAALAAVPAAVYAAALSAVEDILPLLPPPRRREMLAAAWSLWTRTQLKSSARAKTLAFFSRLVSTPAATLYTPLPPTGEPLVLQEEAASWVAAIPKFLWELGTAAPLTTGAALQFLLNAARYSVVTKTNNDENHNDEKSPLQKVLAGLHPQLTPLFGILMPQTIKNNNSNNKIVSNHMTFVPGPLAFLPESTQSLAIDILYYIPGLPDSILNIVAYVALGGGKFPTSTIVRFVDVAVFKAAEVADSAHFWGILLALVSGTSRSGVEKVTEGQEEGWQRHEIVVEAGCRAAVSAAGSAQDAFKALGPALVDTYREKKIDADSGSGNGEESSRSMVGIAKVLYGLITLCSATFRKTINTTKKGTEEDRGHDANTSSMSIIAEALPEFFLEYVRICIECAAVDPVVHVSRPHAAATAAVKVIAAEPALLLGPTLSALTASVSPRNEKLTTKSALETALLLLLDIAGNNTLESELVKCSSEAETVVKALKSAVENRNGGGLNLNLGSLSHGLHRLVALMSQKLGIEQL